MVDAVEETERSEMVRRLAWSMDG